MKLPDQQAGHVLDYWSNREDVKTMNCLPLPCVVDIDSTERLRDARANAAPEFDSQAEEGSAMLNGGTPVEGVYECPGLTY